LSLFEAALWRVFPTRDRVIFAGGSIFHHPSSWDTIFTL